MTSLPWMAACPACNGCGVLDRGDTCRTCGGCGERFDGQKYSDYTHGRETSPPTSMDDGAGLRGLIVCRRGPPPRVHLVDAGGVVECCPRLASPDTSADPSRVTCKRAIALLQRAAGQGSLFGGGR